MMIQTVFGNRVKELRNGLLVPQVELSEKSGIERTQICKIEKEKEYYILSKNRISNTC